MKKKSILVSLSFAILILVAILVQSIHSYEHFASAKKEEKCHHNHNSNKTEINDLHLKSHHCFVCEFTFSPLLEINNNTISLYYSTIYYKLNYFNTSKNNSFFNGSSFFLRGPPVVYIYLT